MPTTCRSLYLTWRSIPFTTKPNKTAMSHWALGKSCRCVILSNNNSRQSIKETKRLHWPNKEPSLRSTFLLFVEKGWCLFTNNQCKDREQLCTQLDEKSLILLSEGVHKNTKVTHRVHICAVQGKEDIPNLIDFGQSLGINCFSSHILREKYYSLTEGKEKTRREYKEI